MGEKNVRTKGGPYTCPFWRFRQNQKAAGGIKTTSRIRTGVARLEGFQTSVGHGLPATRMGRKHREVPRYAPSVYVP